MKLHTTAIDRLVRIFSVYGGHREEWRLKHELAQLDLTAYNQQSTGRDVLVPTDQFKK